MTSVNTRMNSIRQVEKSTEISNSTIDNITRHRSTMVDQDVNADQEVDGSETGAYQWLLVASQSIHNEIQHAAMHKQS